ncbi:unnamed protein product, partial [Mesorhabditis spiculigera]
MLAVLPLNLHQQITDISKEAKNCLTKSETASVVPVPPNSKLCHPHIGGMIPENAGHLPRAVLTKIPIRYVLLGATLITLLIAIQPLICTFISIIDTLFQRAICFIYLHKHDSFAKDEDDYPIFWRLMLENFLSTRNIIDIPSLFMFFFYMVALL